MWQVGPPTWAEESRKRPSNSGVLSCILLCTSSFPSMDMVGTCLKAGVSCPTILWYSDLIRCSFSWMERRTLKTLIPRPCSYPACQDICSRVFPAGLRNLINNHDSSLWTIQARSPLCLLLITVWSPRGVGVLFRGPWWRGPHCPFLDHTQCWKQTGVGCVPSAWICRAPSSGPPSSRPPSSWPLFSWPSHPALERGHSRLPETTRGAVN